MPNMCVCVSAIDRRARLGYSDAHCGKGA
jgi:hypothetical protein